MVSPGLASWHCAILGDPRRAGTACGPMSGDVFVTSGQWMNRRHGFMLGSKR